NAHRQEMQKNCFRCSVHGRKLTDVFSPASQLAEKLRAAHYLIDPCWSNVRRAAASLSWLARLPRQGRGLWSGFSVTWELGGKGHRGDSAKGCRSSFGEP